MSDPKEKIRLEILRFLEAKYPKSYTASQVTRALGHQPKQFERLFNDLLNELVQARKLERRKGKTYSFMVPDTIIEGKLMVTRSGTGFVRMNEETEVAISERNLLTAFHEDLVQVQVYPKRTGDRTEGQVIRVIERGRQTFVGTIEKQRHFHVFVPDDPRIHRDFYITNRNLNKARPGDKVMVALEEWTNPFINPEARVTEILGNSKDLKVQVISVARGLNLDDAFPAAIEKEAADLPGIRPEDLSGREDWRDRLVITIDPDDAKDFDDAVSLTTLPDGLLELGVHIADVSHYVVPGGAIDREAQKRGTSIYLVDRVIPMLPERLSNHLCSLVPHEDRLTVSAIITLTPAGAVRSARFARTVIHSKRRFTYEEVQKILDSGAGEHADLLQEMNRLAQALQKRRFKNGSIDFDTPEARFRFNDKGEPIAIVRKERLASHRLIEDFMLLANQVAARSLGSLKTKHGIQAVYRIHDLPDTGKLFNLSAFVKQLGYQLVIGDEKETARHLQKLMESVRGTPEENVVHDLALRSMAKARYSADNIGHFGLGFSDYTHFTSPIRRYPDLLVHRLLIRHIIGQEVKPFYGYEALAGLAEQCSMTERKAVEAERESVKLMQVEYMKSRIGDSFDAIISGVTQYGLYVQVQDTLVEGMISIRDLNDDYYTFIENGHALHGERKKQIYRLGDPIRVVCMNADPTKRQIDFIPAR
ncbi:MAG: ribonuclease R [Bacteroidetes bacterium]|nr:ribonuclease R [Bacteroidota bacterium]